jgi:opacity protein-like surface antigen
LKNRLLLLFLFLLVGSSAQAQNGLNPSQKWLEQIDGSFSIPSSAATSKFNPGLGGDINIGYRLDKTWALLLGVGIYEYDVLPAPSGQWAYIPLTGILRATLGDGSLRPFIFFGLGGALNTYSETNPLGSPTPQTSKSEIDFYMAPGLGVLYVFASNMAVFLQSRIDLDYVSSNGMGIPLSGPLIFIPLQAGISFFAF